MPSLRNKLLMPQASRVTDIIAPPCIVPKSEIRASLLPGHFFAMAGFMTPDKVFFAADTLASPEILAKYHVFYMYDVAAFLKDYRWDILAGRRLDRAQPCPSDTGSGSSREDKQGEDIRDSFYYRGCLHRAGDPRKAAGGSGRTF